MDKKREWPEGFWEQLIARSEDLADDFEPPEPLPDSPHRDRVIDEWVASTYLEEGTGETADHK